MIVAFQGVQDPKEIQVFQAFRAALEVKDKQGNQDQVEYQAQRVTVVVLALLDFQVIRVKL